MKNDQIFSKGNQFKIEDDILYHLQLVKIDLERLLIDNNRNVAIQYSCENLLKKIILIENLYLIYDKPIFRGLKNKINQTISTIPNLKGFFIIIENSRYSGEDGKIEQLKIII